MSNSTILKASSVVSHLYPFRISHHQIDDLAFLFAQELATEDRSIIEITDQSLDTNVDIELLESMGVYQEHILSGSTLPKAGGLCARRKYVRHGSTNGCQIEFTSEQLASMLSKNHYRRPQERHDRKVPNIIMENIYLCRSPYQCPFHFRITWKLYRRNSMSFCIILVAKVNNFNYLLDIFVNEGQKRLFLSFNTGHLFPFSTRYWVEGAMED